MDYQQSILVVCADSKLTRRYFDEMEQPASRITCSWPSRPRRLASDFTGLRRRSFCSTFRRPNRAAARLPGIDRGHVDRGCGGGGGGGPGAARELAFLISSGVVDFVARSGDFVGTAVCLIEKRASQALARSLGAAVFRRRRAQRGIWRNAAARGE